ATASTNDGIVAREEAITVTVAPDDTAVLPCYMENVGPRRVIWKKTSEYAPLTISEYVFRDNYRFSIARPSTEEWNLQIDKAQYSDQGEYTCEMSTRSNSNENQRQTVVLLIQEPTTTATAATPTTASGGIQIGDGQTQPNLDLDALTVRASQGSTVVLPCHVEMLGTRKVAWRKTSEDTFLTISTIVWGHNPRLSVVRRSPVEWNLQIRDVQYSDQGEYKCQFGNEEKTVVLSIEDQTQTSLHSDAVTVMVTPGSTAVLPCHIEMLGPRRVIWKKAQENMPLAVSGYVLSNDARLSIVRPSTDEWNLQVLDVQYSDQGQYTCEMSTHRSANQRQTVNLFVQEGSSTTEPVTTTAEAEDAVDGDVKTVTVTLHHTAVLPCRIEGNTQGEIRIIWTNWRDSTRTFLTYNDRRITDDSRISVERPYSNEWNLHIRDVGNEDQGEFICSGRQEGSSDIINYARVLLRVQEGSSTTTPVTTTAEDAVDGEGSLTRTPVATTTENAVVGGVTTVTVTLHHTAVLPCRIEGNTQGNIRVIWRDSAGTVLTYQDRRLIDDSRISVERPYSNEWNLHIRDVGNEDQGEFICSGRQEGSSDIINYARV
ncbi:hypothetical protein EGW08_019508, partial [Elysia chlorotica]